MIEPKGWKLESTQTDGPLGTTSIYTRGEYKRTGGEYMLAVSRKTPRAPYHISIRHDGRYPKGKLDFVKALFPPGEWTTISRTELGHHWHYTMAEEHGVE